MSVYLRMKAYARSTRHAAEGNILVQLPHDEFQQLGQEIGQILDKYSRVQIEHLIIEEVWKNER